MAPDMLGPPKISLTLRLVAIKLAEVRESNPVATPPSVTLQVLESKVTLLVSFPRLICPPTVRLPPVSMPEPNEPNEAEIPEPVWGGEEGVGPGTEAVKKTTGFWTWGGMRFSMLEIRSWTLERMESLKDFRR